MLTDALRVLVNNPFKESFYRKRKGISMTFYNAQYPCLFTKTKNQLTFQILFFKKNNNNYLDKLIRISF